MSSSLSVSTRGKLSDFGLSHCLDGEADIGALKQCLPVYLCPPEVSSVTLDCLTV